MLYRATVKQWSAIAAAIEATRRPGSGSTAATIGKGYGDYPVTMAEQVCCWIPTMFSAIATAHGAEPAE